MKTAPFISLLSTSELAALGPGPRPGVKSLATLQEAVDAGLDEAQVEGKKADLIRATIYLWHDHLDAAHELAQEVENRDGSYVHAIMHRREPDYGNAKYWFQRVGQHACYAKLAVEAGKVLKQAALDRLEAQLMPRGQWDAFGFVDACEEESDSSDASRGSALREVQRVEFEVLLSFLVSGVAG